MCRYCKLPSNAQSMLNIPRFVSGCADRLCLKRRDTQCTFHRFEKKYSLAPRAYRRLRRLMADRMTEDEYGLHTITSVHFDADAYEIIRSAVQKPLFKEKLRLRLYGNPKPGDPVFLELKRKYRGLVYKRRVPV